MNAILPILLAAAWGVLFFVIASRRQGRPVLAAARSILVHPRAWFLAAGVAAFVALSVLAVLASDADGLRRGDRLLAVVLGGLAVVFATVGGVLARRAARPPS